MKQSNCRPFGTRDTLHSEVNKKKNVRETLNQTLIEHIIGCLSAEGTHLLIFVYSPQIPS